MSHQENGGEQYDKDNIFLIDNLGEASLLLVGVTRYNSSLTWEWSGFCLQIAKAVGAAEGA